MDLDKIKARCEQLLAVGSRSWQGAAEICSGALSVAIAVYGPESGQVEALKARIAEARAGDFRSTDAAANYAKGLLSALVGEIDAGLVGNLRLQLVGEVLTDLVAMAREALATGGDHTNVAAVLTAAAFEGTLRRMGEAYAGITDAKVDLSDVVLRLRDAKKLEGAAFRQAQQAGLPFRNRALHANFAEVDRPSTESLLGFVDALLRQSFS